MIAGAHGASLLEFTFSVNPNSFTCTETSIANLPAGGLVDLEFVPSPAASPVQVIALAADNQTLVSLIDSGSGFSVETGFAPQTVGTATSLCAGYFGISSSLAIAAATTSGLEFFDLLGVTQGTHLSPGTGGYLAALDLTNGQCVALARTVTGGGSEILTATQTACSPIASLGAVLGASAADFNGNAKSDLALSPRDASQVLLLRISMEA
jgi:hypothetical protein